MREYKQAFIKSFTKGLTTPKAKELTLAIMELNEDSVEYIAIYFSRDFLGNLVFTPTLNKRNEIVRLRNRILKLRG
tara:strand:- start:242 stop:469 length:228 start_codon:yes stop_codon:yes gene_type:complete